MIDVINDVIKRKRNRENKVLNVCMKSNDVYV